jgi:hypothetical protein
MNMLRSLPGARRAFLHAALLACVVPAGYDVCRAAPAEVPVDGVPDVVAADREFAQTALDAGMRAAYDRYLADDAVMFRPLPVRAREWLASHEPATGRLEWTPALAEAACDSSLAVTLGTWSYVALDSKVADTGQYLTVWRPGEAGAWRIVLDQSIGLPSIPAPSMRANDGCTATSPTIDKLLATERKLNTGLRSLRLTESSNIDIKAVTMGSVSGSARADLAVTHGELVDKRATAGSEPQVRAVYVRVWQRDGRAWRVLHDFMTPVLP